MLCRAFQLRFGGCVIADFRCIFFLKLKSDYLKAFKLYLVEVKRLRSTMGLSSDYHMVLHTDGDSTMIAGQTAAFCKQHGIEQQHGFPYLHENQARVERSHRDVQAMARALLLTSGFGVEMWPLAARHAVFILNCIFRKSFGWTSAYYRIYEKHADLSHLRVFGCRAYPFIDPTVREHKLSNRARELRYVGHSEVSSAYLLYDHESGKVVNSGMVTFSERLDKLGKAVTTWDPSAVTPLKTNFMATALDAPDRDPPPVLFEDAVLEQSVYLPEDGDEVIAVVKVETSDGMCWVSLSSYLEPGGERLSLLRACPTYGHVNAQYPLFTEVCAVTGKGDSEEAMVSGRAITPHAQPYCVVLLTNFTVMDLPAGKVQFPPTHTCLGVKTDVTPTVQSSLLPEGVTEPKSHSQVLIAPDCAEWLDSIQDELEALVQIKRALLMMDEEDVPAGVKLLDMPLVLKVKLDKHRQLLKRKSRICVRGNKQQYGVDYYDTFAPCTRLSSIRIVITLALNLGLVVYHMDVDTAFLNSVLEEDLMQRSDVEPCLYFIRDTDIMVIILAYVDDYLVATNDKSWRALTEHFRQSHSDASGDSPSAAGLTPCPEGLRPAQIGVAVKGGVDLGVHTVQAALDRHPEWAVERDSGRSSGRGRTSAMGSKRASGSGWGVLMARLVRFVKSWEGAQQRDSWGPLYLAAPLQTALERVQEGQPEVIVLAYLDDALLVGPPFATAGAYDAYSDSSWVPPCKVGDLLDEADTGFLAEEMPGARGELDFINILGEPVGKPEVVTAEMLRKVEEMHGILPALNETNARGAPGLAAGGWPSLVLLRTSLGRHAAASSDGYREDLGVGNRLPHIWSLQTAMQKLSEAVEEIEEARG
eukprot:gene34151-biopygen16581